MMETLQLAIMTDYNITNTDINEEKNFREWEKLVMEYEPVRRNLYEVYCKSLKKPEPIVEPEPKPIVEPTLTINTSFLNRQLQELKNEEEELELENGSSDDCFSSDEEEEEEEQVVVEEVKEEVKEEYRTDPTTIINLQFFKLEIPKMNLSLNLYHKNTANKHISFTTDSVALSQPIVIQKEKKFWIDVIDESRKRNFTLYKKNIQLNKNQKDILLAAFPYDKKRLPTMFITHIKD